MDNFARIRCFIQVVNSGSFSAAARHVSSTSSVTRQIKSLEDELGTRLLNRSTRSLSLTDAGRRLYDRAIHLVQELDDLTSEVKSLHDDVKGTLRVSLRITSGTTVVVPALPKLLKQYPELEFDIMLTDERRDLVANNIDVALWLGDLPNSELVAKRLSPSRRMVCGTPEYFQQRGIPRKPDDLKNHDCLLFAAPSYKTHWGFTHKGEHQEIDVHGSIRSDNGLVLLSAALSNLGLIIGHEWMVRGLLAEGRLTRVLADYTVNPRPGDADLYAVYSSSRGLSKKTRVFLDFLAEIFKPKDA